MRALACGFVCLASCTFAVRPIEPDDTADTGVPSDGPVPLADAAAELDLAMPLDLLSLPDLAAGPCAASPSLVACYRFEDAAHPTQVRDDSMYGNHAAAAGLTFAPGIDGTAAVLGPASSIRAADSASLDVLNAFTLEVWVRPTSLPATGRVGIIDDDGQYGMFIGAGGELRCAAAATLLLSGQNEVAPGAWSHLACAWDGTTLRMFHNGKLITSAPLTGVLGTGSTAGLAIGANSPSGDELTGALDDLRIWNVARSAQQLCASWGGGGC